MREPRLIHSQGRPASAGVTRSWNAPLLLRLTDMAAGRRYDEMATRISMTMGGLGVQLASGFGRDGKQTWQKMIFRMRAMKRNIPEAVALLGDIFAAGDLTDRRRIDRKSVW